MVEHHIQREIMNRLMHNQVVRFKDLKPLGMESNIFMYHLKQLTKEGYVEKTDEGYTLAAAGLTYVDGLNAANQKLQPQPKVVCILAIHDNQGRWLMAERKIQPYIGMHMLVSNHHHLGETTAEHIARQLRTKLALDAVSPLYRGQVEIVIYDTEDSKKLLTHIVGSVHQITIDLKTALPPETDHFRYVWVESPEETTTLLAGTKELITEILGKENFFFTHASSDSDTAQSMV